MVLGRQTAPNPFSGAQQHSVVSSGSGGSRPPVLSAHSVCPELLAGCRQRGCTVRSLPSPLGIGCGRALAALLGVTQLSLPLSLPAGCLPGEGLAHPLPVSLAHKRCCGLRRGFYWALGCFFTHPAESFLRQSRLWDVCEAQHRSALPSAQGEVTSVPLGVNYSKPHSSKTCQYSGKRF